MPQTRTSLSDRVIVLNRELRERGVPGAYDSVAAFLRAQASLVDSVRFRGPTTLYVWWHGLGQLGFLLYDPVPLHFTHSDFRYLRELARQWRRELSEGDLIVCGRRGLVCLAKADSDKAAVRAEIERARETPLEQFVNQKRVLLAQELQRQGRLPDSLRYLAETPTWQGSQIPEADEAELFREPPAISPVRPGR